jgi:hypothetical protein
MDKTTRARFQVFVSSTFRDLIPERQAILNAILRLRQIPMGMETFPAVNQTPWELIQRLIDESDFYVLVIGGRYGSMDANGISYTEKEYDLAIDLSKPVFAFIHAAPEEIPVKNSDTDPAIIAKLEKFKEKVNNRHHGNPWRTATELERNVIASLSVSIFETPSGGWVRASKHENKELLERLVTLQGQFDGLKAENERLKTISSFNSDSELFAGGTDNLAISLDYVGEVRIPLTVHCIWDDLFYLFAPLLLEPKTHYQLLDTFLRYLFLKLIETDAYRLGQLKPAIKDGKPQESIQPKHPDLQAILTQFMALGLAEMMARESEERNPNSVRSMLMQPEPKLPKWFLTVPGKRKYLRHVAFLKTVPPNQTTSQSLPN